jgi:hypothetical protein
MADHTSTDAWITQKELSESNGKMADIKVVEVAWSNLDQPLLRRVGRVRPRQDSENRSWATAQQGQRQRLLRK